MARCTMILLLVIGISCLSPAGGNDTGDIDAEKVSLQSENANLLAKVQALENANINLKAEVRAAALILEKNLTAGGNIGATGLDLLWIVLGQLGGAVLQTIVLITFIKREGYVRGKMRWPAVQDRAASLSAGKGR